MCIDVYIDADVSLLQIAKSKNALKKGEEFTQQNDIRIKFCDCFFFFFQKKSNTINQL